MSFISLYRGSRLPALPITQRCTTRASVSTLRGGRKSGKSRQFQTWWFGNDHSTCALLSLLLRIVRDARVSGCEPRAPVPPLFVKQTRRPLRHEQQAEKKNESRVAPARRARVHMRITFKPCDVRERMQSFARARAKSFMGALWKRVFVVAALTRKKNSFAFARHLPPNQLVLWGTQHAQNTLACAQTALGSGRCAHLSAPCLHRHRANLGIHIQMGTSHPTPRG